jgi:hypothetical protein
MATAPSPNDLTRQQLDELDALLQRMLSVPLAPPDTPMPGGLGRGASDGDAPPLPPSWRIDPPAPAASASIPHLVLAEPPSAVKPEPPAPPPAPKPAPPAPKPIAKATPAPPPPAPVPAPVPAPKAASIPAPAPKPIPRPVEARAVTPAPSAPPVALPLLPLVALNALFDGACGVFGPLGRVLRSGFFKHIYGLIGLGLLAYTAAHVAQVREWITLPVTLPWPPK